MKKEPTIKFNQLYRGIGITQENKISEIKEYRYKCYLITDSTIYMIDPYFTAYEANAEKAKATIKTQSEFCSIVDALLDGIIIKLNGFEAATIISRGEAIRHGLNI